MAGTLFLEAIVVLLALPVVWRVGGGITPLSGAYIVGLAVLMVIGGGLQRRSWALRFDIALQVAMIGTFFINFTLGALGVVFALVWAYILYLRADMKDRIERGLLPGQRDDLDEARDEDAPSAGA